MVEIVMRSGRILVSTPEHCHFAHAGASNEAAYAEAGAGRAPMRLRSGTLEFRELRAEAILPGMAMLQGNGMSDLVAAVRRFPGAGVKVFDIDVFPTHN